jgi:acyl carrier protein
MRASKEDFEKILLKELDFHITVDTEVTLSARLKEDLDLDSLECIEILLSLEDKHEVKIDNTMMDMKEILTVQNLSDFVWERVIFPEDFALKTGN